MLCMYGMSCLLISVQLYQNMHFYCSHHLQVESLNHQIELLEKSVLEESKEIKVLQDRYVYQDTR